jgi:hypothetical protein
MKIFVTTYGGNEIGGDVSFLDGSVPADYESFKNTMEGAAERPKDYFRFLKIGGVHVRISAIDSFRPMD